MDDRIGRCKHACKYPNCKNKYYNPIYKENYVNKCFFKFPSCTTLSNIWKDICNIDLTTDCTNFRICEDHFEDKDLKNFKRQKLNYRVVPKKFEPTKWSEEHTANLIVDSLRGQPSSPHSNMSNNIPPPSIINLLDHAYSLAENENNDKYAFLSNEVYNFCMTENSKDQQENCSNSVNLKTHIDIQTKLSKLKDMLGSEVNQLKTLRKLAEQQKFKIIEQQIDSLSTCFINSQLKDAEVKGQNNFTNQDKITALTLYTKHPNLYKYLKCHFVLPLETSLKEVLYTVPFDTGINAPMLDHLKMIIERMSLPNRHCSLLFGEISLRSGLYYEGHEQKMYGYKDLGPLGRSSNRASHALVFMVRGLIKSWKQVVAYYFTDGTMINCMQLKKIITNMIKQLQGIGLNLVTIVCDQTNTNLEALKLLCLETKSNSNYYFTVNDKRIFIIYNVSTLIRSTRNALNTCEIKFGPVETAKLCYIKSAFYLDLKRAYKMLYKLKREHFDLDTSSVKVAATHLSHSVAAGIETFVMIGKLPFEAMFTAEFAEKIDALFDSLNGVNIHPDEGKEFRCAISENSPHLKLWSDLLVQLRNWKLFDIYNGNDVTGDYCWIDGWQTTIKSVMNLWIYLENKGFTFISLRALNKDPLENFFNNIQAHYGNPTCYEFITSLKIQILNNLPPADTDSNCEIDNCTNLSNLVYFLEQKAHKKEAYKDLEIYQTVDFDLLTQLSDNQANGYMAGYILGNISIPDCENCRTFLLTKKISNKQVNVQFRQTNVKDSVLYVHKRVISLVEKIHQLVYDILKIHGHEINLGNKFKKLFNTELAASTFCKEHSCVLMVVEKCIVLVAHKFAKENGVQRTYNNVRSEVNFEQCEDMATKNFMVQ